MSKRKVHEPYNRLKGALRERGLTYDDISKTLEISETAVGFKINGTSDFYISEVETLRQTYDFSLQIFLN